MPKLIYFSGRGRAEIARILFAAGGVEFKDERIKFTMQGTDEMVSPEFDKLRKSLPFGQLPFLEWGDLKIAQSFAIMRYVAKKVGLAGKDAEEDAKIDMVADHISDHMEGLGPFFELKDEAAKKEYAAKSLDKKIPLFLAKSEELLKKAGGKYFVGDRMTWADIAMMERLNALADPDDPLYANFADGLIEGDKEKRTALISGYPLLSGLRDRIINVPEIKKWMDNRPASKDEPY